MALYWFQCTKCETLIKKDSSPNSSGCPSGHFHDWKKLAEIGDTNYQCKKCGTTIQAKASPSSSGCPSGHFHDWKKL
jgi:predicted  nucleic acid-binding Zn-ribbon protein